VIFIGREEGLGWTYPASAENKEKNIKYRTDGSSSS